MSDAHRFYAQACSMALLGQTVYGDGPAKGMVMMLSMFVFLVGLMSEVSEYAKSQAGMGSNSGD